MKGNGPDIGLDGSLGLRCAVMRGRLQAPNFAAQSCERRALWTSRRVATAPGTLPPWSYAWIGFGSVDPAVDSSQYQFEDKRELSGL